MKENIEECLENIQDMQSNVSYQSTQWWYLEGSKDAYNNLLEEVNNG